MAVRAGDARWRADRRVCDAADSLRGALSRRDAGGAAPLRETGGVVDAEERERVRKVAQDGVAEERNRRGVRGGQPGGRVRIERAQPLTEVGDEVEQDGRD